MKQSTTLFALLAGFASSVAAHGYVNSTYVNGGTFTGWLPDYDNWAQPVPQRITRHVPDDGPVFDFTSANMTCNVGAQDTQWRTKSHAAVDAGSDVTFNWVRWLEDHRGPVTTWMALCGDDCTDFDGSGSVWFKIDELGLISGTTDGTDWASLRLLNNSLQWTVTIPPTLKSGAYLLRTEILALHSAHAPQFYPSCQQVIVRGTGTDFPDSSEMVAIPGYYKADMSTTEIDIWQNGQTSYTIAGPAVTKLQKYTSSNPTNLLPGGLATHAVTAGQIITLGNGGALAAAGQPDSSSSSGSSSSSSSAAAVASSSSAAPSSTPSAASSASAAAASATTSQKSCRAARKKRDEALNRRRASDSKRHVSSRKQRLTY